MQKTLKQIADIVKGELSGDPDYIIRGVGPIEQAESDQITFAEKGKGLRQIPHSRAGAIVIPPGDYPNEYPPDEHENRKNLIQVDTPRLAFAELMKIFHPPALPEKGIHPSAVMGRNCSLGQDIAVCAGVVVGNDVTLGDRVVLHPNVVVGDNAIVGDDTIIHPQVAILDHCRVGRRVIIHSGSVIGSDGFGFVPDPNGHFHKIPQTGIVQIDDDVEIGANNTIDRATFGRTWIQAGVKTDNLVHIAHNVTIGKHCAIAGQVGFAGSTTIGSHVIIAGQAGIGGHLKVADGATIGPQAAVAQSVETKQVVSGTTLAMPHRTWLRLQRILPDLPQLHKEVRTLQKLVQTIQEVIK